MADISDVENALIAIIDGIIYPNGDAQPSVTAMPAKIYGGWPQPGCVDADMAATPPVTNISVYPAAMNRNTTRYLDDWKQVSIQTATLALVSDGQTILVVGTIPTAGNPHNMVAYVNGKPYVYQASFVDSLTSIALKLAALIAAGVPGTLSTGPVITLPTSARIDAVRVGVTGVSAMLTRNQEQVFQIGIWAPTPVLRDLFAKTIDTALSQIRRFLLPDNSYCRLIWKNSVQSDKWQKQALFRRDLFYTCEYATIAFDSETQITSIIENVSAAVAGVAPSIFIGTFYDVRDPGPTGFARNLVTESHDVIETEDNLPLNL